MTHRDLLLFQVLLQLADAVLRHEQAHSKLLRVSSGGTVYLTFPKPNIGSKRGQHRTLSPNFLVLLR
jgi:hypothetical protein